MTELDQPEPQTKEELIRGFKTERDGLFESITGLEGEDMEEVIPGWTLKDLLAHIVEWDWQGIKDVRDFLESGDVNFEHHLDNDSFNAKSIAKHRQAGFESLVDDLRRSTEATLDFLNSISEEELFRQRGLVFKGDEVDAVWFLYEKGHDLVHAKQILDWRRQKGV